MASPASIYRSADRLPRARLAHLPTPLEEVPRFAEDLNGVRVFVKRDDCTGLLLGGNKARHNEFLLGDAVAQGCDVVVWGAGVQSNNCRQTAAGCARLGLDCHLYLTRMNYRTEPQGNLLLDYLVGAKVEFTDAAIGPDLEAFLKGKAAVLRTQGRKPYVWDRPRVVPLAAVSYAVCVAEIVEQLAAQNLTPSAIYVSSSGSTGSGVALGLKMLDSKCRARLVCPMTWPWDIPTAIAADATTAARMMGWPTLEVTPADFDVYENYVEPGYGYPSAAGRAALDRLARTEAILLDPVYSAKAMAALRSDCRNGINAPGSVVVFIHTGGVPAIFAEPEKVLPEA